MNSKFLDEQSLRLLRAFLEIKDREARELIITLSEAAARGQKIEAYRSDDATGPKR